MTPEQALAICARYAVHVQWHTRAGRVVRFSPRNNGILRPGQRPIPGHVSTTEAEYRAKRQLVFAAVAVLDAAPPVETPAPDAAQLSFLAA